MELNIEYIKESLTENNIRHTEILSKLDSLNNKFAGKWVENIAIGALITVLGGISALALLAL